MLIIKIIVALIIFEIIRKVLYNVYETIMLYNAVDKAFKKKEARERQQQQKQES